MTSDESTILRQHGIQPSAQRVAVARFVLHTQEHPSADEVWAKVRAGFPQVSRATIYNTLHLFVEKGLLRQFDLGQGRVIFDPNTRDHHHFIDEVSETVHDVPWDAIRVSDISQLDGFEVREYQVVLRGKKTQTR